MTARELEDIQKMLSHQGRRFRVAFVRSGVAAVAACGLVAFSVPLAAALEVFAIVEAVVAAIIRYTRNERIARLALNADAYMIPEVAEYGRRCAEKRERDRTAAWIREVVAGDPYSNNFHLADRVARSSRELERIAMELASATSVRPPVAVACRRLLTHAVESPLYNPGLPAEDLRHTLDRLQRGIRLG
jgi:hypothetical protein